MVENTDTDTNTSTPQVRRVARRTLPPQEDQTLMKISDKQVTPRGLPYDCYYILEPSSYNRGNLYEAHPVLSNSFFCRISRCYPVRVINRSWNIAFSLSS